MKSINHKVVIASMTSSIVLLVVLQGFWLHNSYEKAYHDFRRETNSLFRTTLFALRDSMFLKVMVVGDRDSAERIIGLRRTSRRFAGDTARAIEQIEVSREGNEVQLFVSSTANVDSVTDALKPFANSIQDVPLRKFIIRMNTDTIKVGTVANRFRETLKQADLELPVLVKRYEDHKLPVIQSLHRPAFGPSAELVDGIPPEVGVDQKNLFSDTLALDFVHLSPLLKFKATLSRIRPVLLKEIKPQIFFSLFLTTLTAGSFFLMYRSIRIQQRLVALKNEFISNVTHELKTPVATVSVALEALQHFRALDQPERTKEYLDMAQAELNRLTVMTDKILKASLFEDDRISTIKESIDLHDLVQQVLNSQQIVFEKRHAKVTYLELGTRAPLLGSSLDLTHVVYNLLDNALKYSGTDPQIEVSLEYKPNHVVLAVKDNGMGIPPEYRNKIFEKFFRVPTGDVHNIKGYGLGLSYVAGVINHHRGSIEVNSVPNEGSTFRITIPKR